MQLLLATVLTKMISENVMTSKGFVEAFNKKMAKSEYWKNLKKE